MTVWLDIKGYAGLYQVSNDGQVKSLAFKQRYLLRNGKEAFRVTKEKILSQQLQNSGYLIVHLYKNGKRKAYCVHVLVAQRFVLGTGATVNHKDGNKLNNCASNLEFCSYTKNLLHAVDLGLNTQAKRVSSTLGTFPSMAQAARATGISPSAISRSARTGMPTLSGIQWVLA